MAKRQSAKERMPIAQALKRLRESTQPKLSMQKVADFLGMPARSSWAWYEDGFKGAYLPPDLVDRVLPLFERHGVPRDKLLALTKIPGSRPDVPARPYRVPAPNDSIIPSEGSASQNGNVAGETTETPDVGNNTHMHQVHRLLIEALLLSAGNDVFLLMKQIGEVAEELNKSPRGQRIQGTS